MIALLTVLALAVSTISCGGPGDPWENTAETQQALIVAQSGPIPIVLTPGTGSDDITVLMATAAERTSTITVYQPDSRKNMWVQTFMALNDYLSWSVSVPSAADYRVTALLNATAGQQFKATVLGTAAQITFTTSGGWQRIDAGKLTLPAGTSTIKLQRLGSTGDVQLKSVEILRDSDVAAQLQRVGAARASADLSWLKSGKYGLMFQYGSWGFPDNVGQAKSLEQQAHDFNVPRFVRTVVDTGAAYVVWSHSWWGYRPDGPNPAVDAIMGNGTYTASRDLIGEVAQALKNQGIRFVLYYHTGTEEAAWWAKQDFPPTFSSKGTGDRSTFFDNWRSVVTAIGSQYGTNLDGFFFDDGMIYYPAPFEELESVARTGNPERFVSWNSWVMPRLTEFQDVWFGENSTGQPTPPGAPNGGNGILTAGPNKGLLEHGMFTMESDWGIHQQNQKIGAASVTSSQAIARVTAAAARSVPLSFDLMMYEDGSVSEKSLAVLNHVRQAVRGTPPFVPSTSTVNDNWSGLTYSAGWSRSTGRGAGDYNDDVSYATANGSYVEFTFVGTGVDVLAPDATNGATGEVRLDGQVIGTFSESGPAYSPQQVVYSARHLAPATHTVRLAKTSGTYWQIDALRFVSVPETWNDTDYWFTYLGTWTHSTGRGAGDHQDDVHWTSTNGDSLTLSFWGTGIKVRGPMSPSDGIASITLDGVQVATSSASFGGAYTPQQLYWSVDYLDPGFHFLTLTKTGGTYLQLDSFTVNP